MNEQWKRLIEAERRVARLESAVQRTNTAITGVQGALRNDSQNVVPPFGTAGGVGSGLFPRLPTSYLMWVTWSTVPTLITGASLNVPADGPALAATVSAMSSGFSLNSSTTNYTPSDYLYDLGTGQLAIVTTIIGVFYVTHSGNNNQAYANFDYSWRANGTYQADSAAGDINFHQGTIVGDTDPLSFLHIEMQWPRRNELGVFIGAQWIRARRKATAATTFTYGPKYAETGVWAFDMECPATPFTTAGEGTIYIRWGESTAAMIAGGTPGSLPTDFIAGGTPGSLPNDFIDGNL